MTGTPPVRSSRSRIRIQDFILVTVAFLIYLAGRNPFVGQWDSFDYLKQTVNHSLSALGFGRPVFVGYNIALWECARRVFHLRPLQVETTAVLAISVLGAGGVLLFSSLARRILPAPAARMATLGFALAPLYAVYAGCVMTEIPMIVALVGAAALLWRDESHGRMFRDLAAGVLFGLAVGMREQAVTLGAAFAWTVMIRRPERRSRANSMLLFGVSSAAVMAGPVLFLYLHDPAAFMARTRVWLRAIPMGESHFWRNVQATLLYALGMCPAAWLALLAGAIYSRSTKKTPNKVAAKTRPAWASPAAGVFCSIVLPVALLWRDADVQLHPRYLLVVLPAVILFSTAAYHRWLPSVRATTLWAALHVAVFGFSQIAMNPLREIQLERKEYARGVLNSVPSEGLIIAGSYSPVFDYYRAIERPGWEILWSGWGWDARAAGRQIRSAWRKQVPVYLCDGPRAWAYFEDERLDIFQILRGCRVRQIAPGLCLVQSRGWEEAAGRPTPAP